VPLAALIIAQDGQEGHVGSAALVPLLGQSLIEFQARQAHGAGATHIVISAFQLPASLVTVFDRLRGDGINVSFARNAREAAESIHPDEALLLFAEGAVASPRRIAELAASAVPMIIVRPHSPETAHLELIDGEHVWAGIARLDGALTRQTAAILGDWSLAPTLLRMAIQAGAGRAVLQGADVADVRVVRTAREANVAGSFLLSQCPLGGADALSRFVVGPAARVAAEVIGRSAFPFAVIAALPLLMVAIALVLASFCWIKSALLLFLLAAFPAEIARCLGQAALRSARTQRWHGTIRKWAGRTLILGVGVTAFWLGLGWGAIVIACWTVWQLLTGKSGTVWRANEEICASLLLLGFVSGLPIAGLIAALVSTLLVPLASLFPSKTVA
jgi:hypothetical protein